MATDIIDRDEAFWREIRELPSDVKERPDLQSMLLFKSKVAQLNRDIEDAIRLRLAGWTASMPNSGLVLDHVFGWQWRRPGPRGGRLFLSTQQAINALRKEEAAAKLKSLPAPDAFVGCLADPVPEGFGAPEND
jgi:hypothetical protein